LEQAFSISFAPEATRELGEAVAYYEQLQQGLGKAFVKEIEAALALIKRWPKSCPVDYWSIDFPISCFIVLKISRSQFWRSPINIVRLCIGFIAVLKIRP
jgi:hypothetical protein